MRTFVALWPDAATERQLSRLDLGSHSRLRPVPPGQWHVTLRFLGEVHDGLVARLGDALEEAVSRRSPSVRCEIGPATAWFSGGRVLVLPAAGLDSLAHELREATAPIVPHRPRGESPFAGHLTLGRVKGSRLGAALPPATAGIPFRSAWTVRSIDLVASHSTATGVRYATLARFALDRPTSAEGVAGRDA